MELPPQKQWAVSVTYFIQWPQVVGRCKVCMHSFLFPRSFSQSLQLQSGCRSRDHCYLMSEFTFLIPVWLPITEVDFKLLMSDVCSLNGWCVQFRLIFLFYYLLKYYMQTICFLFIKNVFILQFKSIMVTNFTACIKNRAKLYKVKLKSLAL